MTREEIVTNLKSNNANILYDQYMLTLKDNQQVVGYFDVSNIHGSNINIWKFFLKNNPINMRFEDKDHIDLNGDDIMHMDRL